MTMATLWSRNREVVWAINAITHHRRHHGGRPEIGSLRRIDGYTLTVAQPKTSWGHSYFTKTRSRHGPTTHLPDRIVLAWRGGRLVGSQIMWMCGSTTESYVLTEEQTYKLCVQCAIRAGMVKVEVKVCKPA
jgi:hypothetical protein